MNTHVLLNLFRGLPSILSLFRNELHIFLLYRSRNNRLFSSQDIKLLKDHILAYHVQILLSLMQCSSGCHKITKLVNP